MPIIRPEEEAIKRLLIYHPRRTGWRNGGGIQPETFYLLTAEGDGLQTAELDNITWTI